MPDEIEKVDNERSHDHVEEETFESSDEIKQEMEEGKADEEVYTDEGREKLVEDDEISPEEEGFMEGAEGRGQQTSCKYCGKMISEEKDIVERKVNGEILLFCCEEHAEKYSQQHQV